VTKISTRFWQILLQKRLVIFVKSAGGDYHSTTLVIRIESGREKLKPPLNAVALAAVHAEVFASG